MTEETFLQRWKKGIAMINPLQQLQAQQKGNWVMVVGLVAGMIVMLWKLKEYWWIELILGASLFNQAITMIAIQQKINMLKKFEEDAVNEPTR
jgi:uncharacterized membrane protein HdeD (DUF308 family)